MASQKSGMPAPSCPVCARSLDLARFRKNAGVTLEVIADTTKISLRFLRAIEDEEFDKLPGGIFSTSYLRQYAAATGYDEAELLAHYNQKIDPAAASAQERTRADDRSFLDRWLKIPAQAQH